MAQETLIDGRRQELLALLDRYTQDGARRVNWLTTQDEQVCARCADREQRGALTVAEVRTTLQGLVRGPGSRAWLPVYLDGR